MKLIMSGHKGYADQTEKRTQVWDNRCSRPAFRGLRVSNVPNTLLFPERYSALQDLLGRRIGIDRCFLHILEQPLQILILLQSG